MTLTWGTLIVGFLALVGLPIAVILLNKRRKNAGWRLLLLVLALVTLGNIVEKLVMGSSPIF